MTDIVTALRSLISDDDVDSPVFAEAADEIERLRNQVDQLERTLDLLVEQEL